MVPDGSREKKAYDLLCKVGLKEKVNSYPSQMSGGEQQRVAIAIALANDPKILLADEPTSALDPELIGEVLEVIKSLAREGKTMVIVTHEMQFAQEIATKVIFMDGGQIVEQGTASKIFTNPDKERTRKFLRRILPEAEYII